MTAKMEKSRTSAQRAVDELRDLIFSGELAAGSDHLESELADRLGMSRTPVREAALILEGQGLLEMRPRKGVRIVPVALNDMREIYDVLTAIESLAAQRAAERHPDEQELVPLAQAIADMDTALETDDRAAWAAADERFHAELVRLGGNERSREMSMRMTDQVRRARQLTLYLRPKPTRSNDDHRAVLEAIRDGDGAYAHDCHWRHRQYAMEMLLKLLEEVGLNRV